MKSVVRELARFSGWLLLIVITALSFVPPELRPQTEAPHNLEHFGIFFATGITFGVGYSRNPAVTAIALTIFAAGIELGQKLVPGRHARWSDFIVDAVALVLATTMASLVTSRTLERGVGES